MSAQHVLIVEDSLVYRRLLSRMLTQWGYIVSEAENGVDALAILENQPVSLVISDWEMPEMNGLTLCREIRRRQFGRYVYLILLTAREDPGDLTQGFEAGADDFLSKPVEQSELRARLHAGARILSLEADLAARNARLSEALRQIEQDLELAARIQQSVLPAHQLRHQGFFSDWIFLPSAWVSGDIFNVFPLGDRLGFYCVDVSGHGVGAAMMSLAVARQFLHGRAVERFLFTADNQPASPAEVVAILNGRFCSDETEIVSYFTLIYGVIDLQTGAGKLCQAGHPTPFIVSPDATVRPVGSGGAPVGLIDHLSWADVSFSLAPGERLCLFSDGITECENRSGEQFGEARLQAWLQDSVTQPLPALLPRFARHLIRWRSGDAQETQAMADDVSLLIIERTGTVMKIETERQASVTILTPAVRRLDASVAVAFKAAIAQEIGEDSTDLIVDFSKIDFIDSSGLGTLVSLMKMMNGKGEMTLCALNPGIRNMFTLTRMDRIFRICEDRTSALAQFNP
ncbi:TPA: anti-sigma factor antagonist [Klebsiella pneumoniae]